MSARSWSGDRRPRKDDAEPDLVTRIIEWLARESDMEMPRLLTLEASLRAQYGAREHYIAAHGMFHLSERNILIQEAWMAGVPTDDIARQFQISRRRVRQICAGLPRPPRLMDTSRAGNASP